MADGKSFVQLYTPTGIEFGIDGKQIESNPVVPDVKVEPSMENEGHYIDAVLKATSGGRS